MRRYWLLATLCALLLTAGAWGALRVWRENSGSGFAAPERLFSVRADADGEGGFKLSAELLGRAATLAINGDEAGKIAFALRAAWLAMPLGARAAYALAVLALNNLLRV